MNEYNSQRKLTTAINTIASTFIKLMVPGPRITEIEDEDSVMILKKHFADEMSTTSFSLPTDRGFNEGATYIQISPSTDANVTVSELALYGIQASDTSYAMQFLVYFLVYLCGIIMYK